MPAASNLLKKLAARLFADSAACEAFLDAVVSPAEYEPALIWLRERPAELPFRVEPPHAWQADFVDRVAIEFRPGRHPLHDEGAFYCLDLSSVFAASVLHAVESPVTTIVDLCAAPGGKSVYAWRLLQPRLLVANEVIGKRTAALISNLRRCQIGPAVAVRADPAQLADACDAAADVVIVDAPCSGQSLIARGKRSPGCFHPATVNMNVKRQRRILGNAARLVAPGGYLAYLTCTYSEKENEANAAWLMRIHPELQPLAVPRLDGFQSHLAEFPSYRLWPQQRIGAGSFAVIFRNQKRGPRASLSLDAIRTVWQRS